MKKPAWTDNQKKAIETRNCDILVSAAAGSGKTAVLTERIIRRLTDPKENVDITDFLIVTFTVAATNELREKVSNAISEAYSENRSLKKLKKQLMHLPQAKILTIDAFCKFVINECSKDLGLPADMTLGDEGELNTIVLESVNEVTEELFSGKHYPDFFDTSFLPLEVRKGFISLIETFSSAKGYDSLNTSIIEFYNSLLTYPEPFKRAKFILTEYRNMLEAYYKDNKNVSFYDSAIGKAVINECNEAVDVSLSLLEEARTLLENEPSMAEKYSPAIESDIAMLTKAKVSKTPAELIAAIGDFAPVRLSSYKCNSSAEEIVAKKVKAYRESAKDIISATQQRYPFYEEKRLYLHIANTFSIACELFSLIKLIDEKITQTKFEKRILSFTDVAHLAYKALVKEGSYNHKTREFEKSDYALSLTEKFVEILIDEYQDVNELQDTIFRAISNSHNRFMVGDIKQSIYKFRGATPEIFMEYRNTFLPIDKNGDPSAPRLIPLQNNFRSDTSVINFVNELFFSIMNYNDDTVYREDDKLVFSKKEDQLLPAEVVLIEEGNEFEYIADKIIEMNTKDNTPFSDICILARKHDSLVKMQEVLKERNVPSDYTPNKNFFESYEISTILSILKVCDNPTDDISLLSVMTSPVFAFLPKELLTIRNKYPKTDIYFSITAYCEVGDDATLKDKCINFIERLNEWKKVSRTLASDSFIWFIYENTHLLNMVKTLNEGDSRKENLITFYNIARNYEQRELRGLTKFLFYIDSIQDEKKRYLSKSVITSCVSLMTIHESKGLEFPVCFMCDTSSMISRADEQKKIVLSQNFGPAFAIPTGKLGSKVNTYALKAAIAETRASSADEVLRLLYVALTRAKNKLIITGEVKIEKFYSYLESATVNSKAFSYSVKNATTVLKMIGAGLMSNTRFKEGISNYDDENKVIECGDFRVSLFKEYASTKVVNLPEASSSTGSRNILTKDEILYALKEKEDTVNAPYKISVSAIREGLLDESDVNGVQSIKKYPDFMSFDSQNISSFTGTAMHTFMQFCDFKNCVNKGIKEEAERLLKYGFINEDQIKVLNTLSLSIFFKSDIYKEIAKSKNVQREKRYTLLMPSSEFYSDNDTKKKLEDKGCQTLIQGVIDCYYENEDDSFTIVDFKTDNVSKDNGVRILKERHSKQLLLYKKAVELIENKKVSRVFIYSFCLGKAIEIN